MYASCLAGIAFNAAGLGICHSLAHALGGRIHMPHGRLNAMLLPRVVAFNAQNPQTARRYAKLAQLCGLAASSRALSAALNRMLTALSLPKTLTVDDPKSVAMAAMEDRCTGTNPRSASLVQLETILRELAQ